jgi:hypothetical protein
VDEPKVFSMYHCCGFHRQTAELKHRKARMVLPIILAGRSEGEDYSSQVLDEIVVLASQ